MACNCCKVAYIVPRDSITLSDVGADMKTTGQLIAFFGPDGSGKSTTATIVDEMCRERGIVTYRYHWRPRMLPSLKNGGILKHDVTRPDELPTRSWFLSLLTYIYFFLDFACAYVIKFRPMLKDGVFIIYERYYYDILFHPKRYKLHPIMVLGNVLTSFTPKPNLIVLMRGDPSVILSRKLELPFEEIVRQQKEMEKRLTKFGKVLNVDVTSMDPNGCAEKVFHELGIS